MLMLIYFIERPHVSLYSNMKLEDAAIWISYCFHIILSRLTILRQVLTPLLFPSRSPANWSGRRTFRSAVSCGAFLSAKPSQNVWHVADPPCLWNSGDFSSQSAVTSKNKFITRQRDAFSLNLSKEVGKQYFRVTNDFYLMKLTVMKGGTWSNNT